MSHLLRKPSLTGARRHDITVANARTPLSPDWGYVGIGLYHLKAGERATEATGGSCQRNFA